MSKMLPLILQVHAQTKNAKSVPLALANCQTELKKLKKLIALDLTLTEVMMFSLLVYNSIEENTNHTVNEFSKHFSCKRVDVLAILPIFEKLHKNRLVQKNTIRNAETPKLSEISYYVEYKMINAINEDKIFSNEKKLPKVNSVQAFLTKSEKLFRDKDYESISPETFINKFIELFTANRHIYIVQMIEDLYKSENFSLDESDNLTEDVEGNNKLRFKPINQYLLVVRIMLNAMNSEFSFMVNEIFNSFAEPMDAFFDEDYLLNGDHPLVTKQLLIKKQGGGVIGDESFEYDNQILSHFGGTEAGDLIKTANNSLLIKPEEIAEKELYFNTDTDKKLNQLKGIIDQSNFKEISKRLKLNFKTNSGICIRLEGPPGCGKTEFAMQIARVTGRPVYKIDLSEQQSMYFGQSERNIKKLFKQYKTFCLFSKVTPIMLWNESDAVFSKRIKVEKTIDQSSNAVQNIILDELDSFDGILIATTNMVDNFDPAFERRFLMKIQFDKPGVAVQQQIWKSKINDLEDEMAFNLASSYALSPAQIENVAKKVMFNELLNEPVNKQVINLFCEEELGSKTKKSVGFNLLKM